MELEHNMDKEHACLDCGKLFLLKWRLSKHMKIHSETTKYCHYFNNELECPFQELGCKFIHESSGKCPAEDCVVKLCQFSHRNEPTDGKDDDAEDNHNDDEATDEKDVDAEDNKCGEASDGSDAEEDYQINENQCHLCKEQLSNKDEMWDHVESVHVEYFQGMLEYAEQNRA